MTVLLSISGSYLPCFSSKTKGLVSSLVMHWFLFALMMIRTVHLKRIDGTVFRIENTACKTAQEIKPDRDILWLIILLKMMNPVCQVYFVTPTAILLWNKHASILQALISSFVYMFSYIAVFLMICPHSIRAVYFRHSPAASVLTSTIILAMIYMC